MFVVAIIGGGIFVTLRLISVVLFRFLLVQSLSLSLSLSLSVCVCVEVFVVTTVIPVERTIISSSEMYKTTVGNGGVSKSLFCSVN